MKRLASLVFPDLPTTIALTQTRRPEYYYKSRGLPKKFENQIGFYYEWRQGILYNKFTGEKVIRNAASLDQARTISINGNNLQRVLYGGSRTAIIKIKQELKEYFLNQLFRKPKVTIREFPLILETKIYINIKGMMDADEDNIAQFYTKALRDSIKEFYIANHKGSRLSVKEKTIVNPKGIIPDDNLEYIIGGNNRVFHTEGKPYMILNFYTYENKDEHDLDYTNKLTFVSSGSLRGRVASAAHELTMLQLAKKFRGKSLVTIDGEIKEEFTEPYQTTYEEMFDVLSQQLLK